MATDRTPAGATRSEIRYFTADGTPTEDKDAAASAEITEFVGAVPAKRTYLNRDDRAARPTSSRQLPEWTPPGDVVDEPDVADATKNTWDVHVMVDGQVRFVETLSDLLLSMDLENAPEAEQKAAVEELRPLPSWAAAPPALRAEVDEWLGTSAPFGWRLNSGSTPPERES